MTNTTPAGTPEPHGLQRTFKFFAIIERVGNMLPNPFWLFWILVLFLAGLRIR